MKHTNQQASQNQQAAELLINALIRGGVRAIVISPGSRSTSLALAAFSHKTRIDVFVVVDERSAAFVALGLAKANATPTVLIATSGSAGAHYYPAIIEAAESGVSLIAITADRPSELHYVGAPQSTNQHSFFGTHATTLAVEAPNQNVDPNYLASVALKALLLAQSHGPVHINIAFRKPFWTGENNDSFFEKSSFPKKLQAQIMVGTRTISAEQYALIKNLFSKATRGLIICGPELHPYYAKEAKTGSSALQCAEALNWPILTDPVSGARFQTTNAPRITSYDSLLRHNALFKDGSLGKPDFVLHFGGTPTSKKLYSWFDEEKKPFLLLVSPTGRIFDPSHAGSLLVKVDPLEFAARIVSDPPTHNTPQSWTEKWRTAEQKQTRFIKKKLVSKIPLWEGQIWHTILTFAPKNLLLHVASGLAIRDFDSFGLDSFRKEDLKVFANRGVNGIDGTIATAAGEALAEKKNMLLVIGDLAFLHDQASLYAIYSLITQSKKASIHILVIDNNGGGIFDLLPISSHKNAFNCLFKTPHHIELQNFAHFCEKKIKITTKDELITWLNEITIETTLETSLRIAIVQVNAEESLFLRKSLWKTHEICQKI